MKKRSTIHHLVLIASLVVCSGSLFGGSGPVHAGRLINTGYFGGVAIKGYDPVAYFTEGRAMKGSKEFVYEWLGTPWYFANARHRDLFAADPIKYAPQFGGYCVLGVAFVQDTANIDPEAWRIIDGKLYLSSNKAELEAIPGELTKAKANWPKVKAKLAQ
jgi:YHS domain-containing protein